MKTRLALPALIDLKGDDRYVFVTEALRDRKMRPLLRRKAVREAKQRLEEAKRWQQIVDLIDRGSVV